MLLQNNSQGSGLRHTHLFQLTMVWFHIQTNITILVYRLDAKISGHPPQVLISTVPGFCGFLFDICQLYTYDCTVWDIFDGCA